jgi:regulatory protein YycI of two-component signal transduction system YycFG
MFMTKKAKILIFFSLIFLVLILYLILTSASVKKADNPGLSALLVKNQTAALPEEDYKIKIKEIFTACEKMAADNSFTAEKVSRLKNQALSLKAPSKKFIELHTNLFIALTKMENYLNNKDEREKTASLEIADQLKVNYSWLSN